MQYVSVLATRFGFYKTIFRSMLTIGSYSQSVHTLWDPTMLVNVCTALNDLLSQVLIYVDGFSLTS